MYQNKCDPFDYTFLNAYQELEAARMLIYELLSAFKDTLILSIAYTAAEAQNACPEWKSRPCMENPSEHCCAFVYLPRYVLHLKP